jgi:hypothetical protein
MPFEFDKTLEQVTLTYLYGDSSVGLPEGFVLDAVNVDRPTLLSMDDLRKLQALITEALAAYDGQGQQAEGDGWIEWKGGDCPVADDCMVDVRLDNTSEIKNALAEYLHWGHDKEYMYSIVAYRLYKPDVYAEFSDLYGVTE